MKRIPLFRKSILNQRERWACLSCVPVWLTVLCAGGLSCGANALSVTHGDGYYKVNNGADLVYYVNDDNCNIYSILYDSQELNIDNTSKGTAVNSGLGSGTDVSSSLYEDGTISKITCETSTITHYLVTKDGDNTLYMATYATAEPATNELRFIARLDYNQFTNYPVYSDRVGYSSYVESTDVVEMSDGTTRSKYYGNQQARNLSVSGIDGDGVGVYVVYGNRESASGGPFFRDIQFKTTTSAAEVYNYMNSNHEQTDDFRVNVLHGPYAYVFNDGTSVPDVPDMSWMGDLDLEGWVSDDERGYVSGYESGISSTTDVTVGWSNSTAQYWTAANASTGKYTSPAMKPGTYTETLYQGELEVATQSVTVTKGATTSSNIASEWKTPSDPVFSIGDWDGAPKGFRNYDYLTLMHPSDSRMDDWSQTDFVAGSSDDSDFPAYEWKAVNNDITIQFNLDSDELTAKTLRIGITAAYKNGRPQVTVNDWTSSVPSASTQPSSRSLTIGTYRGNNHLYTFTIPASALVEGTNSLTIAVASGSSTGANNYLSPGISFDAIDMY